MTIKSWIPLAGQCLLLAVLPPAQAQPALTNLLSTGKELWTRAMLGLELKGATSRLDSASTSSPAASTLDRLKIASLKAMVAKTAPGGLVDRALEASVAKLEAEAIQHRLQARESGLAAERQNRLNQLAAAIERRLSETRLLRTRLAEEHLKLKAELDRLERGVDIDGSGKLKRLDQGNSSLRKATERLDRRDP